MLSALVQSDSIPEKIKLLTQLEICYVKYVEQTVSSGEGKVEGFDHYANFICKIIPNSFYFDNFILGFNYFFRGIFRLFPFFLFRSLLLRFKNLYMKFATKTNKQTLEIIAMKLDGILQIRSGGICLIHFSF